MIWKHNGNRSRSNNSKPLFNKTKLKHLMERLLATSRLWFPGSPPQAWLWSSLTGWCPDPALAVPQLLPIPGEVPHGVQGCPRPTLLPDCSGRVGSGCEAIPCLPWWIAHHSPHLVPGEPQPPLCPSTGNDVPLLLCNFCHYCIPF